MFAANLRWSPVRLESRRISKNRHEIFRDDRSCGFVERYQGTWRSRVPESWTPQGDCRDHPSWIAAVLRLARYSMIWTSSDGPQDHGLVRMLRVNCGTAWYTVIAKGDRRYVYEDASVSEQPRGRDQAVIWKVFRTAEAHLRDHPLREAS